MKYVITATISADVFFELSADGSGLIDPVAWAREAFAGGKVGQHDLHNVQVMRAQITARPAALPTQEELLPAEYRAPRHPWE